MNFSKWLAGIVATIIVFSFGYGLGSGRLDVGSVRLDSNKNSTLPSGLDYSEIDDIYKQLRQNYDGELKYQDLLDGLKSGLVQAAGDPYTEYFNAEEAKDLESDLSGSFTGIGAELGFNDGKLVIVAPLKGFPAEEAGLRANDAILLIDGKSTNGISLSDAVSQIRGPKGTKVKLEIQRGNEQFDVIIVRDSITISSVEYEVKPGKIGYIKINRFSEDTADLATKAAEDLMAKNVRGIVLDLRNNPGGYLDAAITVSSLWVPEGEVVLKEGRLDGDQKSVRSEGPGILGNIKTVVLVNEGSASASEIVSGALRDNGKAKLIGAKTFGKGRIQTLIKLKNGGILKVTTSRWYTPNGTLIDLKGLEPDTKIDLTSKDFEKGRDPQLDAALKSVLE